MVFGIFYEGGVGQGKLHSSIFYGTGASPYRSTALTKLRVYTKVLVSSCALATISCLLFLRI